MPLSQNPRQRSEMTIHQFTPSVASGDGVSGGVLLTQTLLRELGFESSVFARQIDPLLSERVESVENFDPSPEDILLYHYSIGHRDHDALMALNIRKIIVYHNITPDHFFTATPHLSAACRWGREQLAASPSHFCAAYADSAYNARELKHLGYPSPQVMTLLIDVSAPLIAPDLSSLPKVGEKYVILFVGRIVTNKSQHQLVDILYALKNRSIGDVLLLLAGGFSDSGYAEFLRKHIELLGLEGDVIITGKISDEALSALYTRADLYLSMSLHEGFGIPMIEAMRYDIPVLGYDTTAIGENLPPMGRLPFRTPTLVAERIIELMENPSARTALISAQREILRRYEHNTLRDRLRIFLEKIIPIPSAHPTFALSRSKGKLIRIDGPCDSTYSLALVNRELGRALMELEREVSFFATEGPGNYRANRHFLADDPQILSALSDTPAPARTIIRNLYPPRVSSMGGEIKLLGPYGWEESAFPSEYVERFNRRLSGIACMSTYVAKVLRDSGVRTPLCVTGLGADHILRSSPSPLGFDLPTGLKLLHVSSCFPRKGVDVLMKALEFLPLPLTLIVKTFPNPHNTLRADLGCEGWEHVSPDRYIRKDKTLLLIEGDLSMAQMRTLYGACDALVAPSRGEGFGLPMAEAMLLNLPVITTAFGGQSDFCTDDTAWLIDYTFTPAESHMGLFDSFWAEPDPHSLAEQIKGVLNASESEKHRKTDAARTLIETRFTWEAAAQKMIDFIHTLESESFSSASPEASFSASAASVGEGGFAPEPFKIKNVKNNIGMVTTYNTKCGIAEYSRHLISPMRLKPTVFAPYGSPLISDEPHVIRCWSANDLSALSREIEQHDIHTLLIQFNYALFDFATLAPFIQTQIDAGRTLYVTLHSTIDDAPADKKLSLLIPVLSRVRGVLVHTLADLNRLRERGLIRNVTLFPHGVIDTSLNPPRPLGTKGFVLASYGFFLPSKGFLELIDTVSLLRASGIDVTLSLTSARYDAPVSEHLIAEAQERIARHGLSDYVTLETRFLSDAESLDRLSRADLIVFPYRDTGESSSAAVRFGLASLKPVAVTPIAIFDELGSAVHRMEGLSPEQMAHSLTSLIVQIRTSDPTIAQTATAAEQWRISHRYRTLSSRLETILST